MIIHKCKEHSSRICWFCIGTTVGFPLEHLLWMKVPGLRSLASVFGVG